MRPHPHHDGLVFKRHRCVHTCSPLLSREDSLERASEYEPSRIHVPAILYLSEQISGKDSSPPGDTVVTKAELPLRGKEDSSMWPGD